jgi:DNA-directed RNA polymerase subunit N (RpoN/RPB10)
MTFVTSVVQEYARRLHQIDDKSKKQQSLGSDEDLARRMAMQQNEMKRQMNTQLQADEVLDSHTIY